MSTSWGHTDDTVTISPTMYQYSQQFDVQGELSRTSKLWIFLKQLPYFRWYESHNVGREACNLLQCPLLEHECTLELLDDLPAYNDTAQILCPPALREQHWMLCNSLWTPKSKNLPLRSHFSLRITLCKQLRLVVLTIACREWRQQTRFTLLLWNINQY